MSSARGRSTSGKCAGPFSGQYAVSIASHRALMPLPLPRLPAASPLFCRRRNEQDMNVFQYYKNDYRCIFVCILHINILVKTTNRQYRRKYMIFIAPSHI